MLFEPRKDYCGNTHLSLCPKPEECCCACHGTAGVEVIWDEGGRHIKGTRGRFDCAIRRICDHNPNDEFTGSDSQVLQITVGDLITILDEERFYQACRACGEVHFLENASCPLAGEDAGEE